MDLHHLQTSVLPNGTIVIEDPPFEAGELVNVTLEKGKKIDIDDPYPLRGTPYSYEDPFSPLLEPDDWKPFQ